MTIIIIPVKSLHIRCYIHCSNQAVSLMRKHRLCEGLLHLIMMDWFSGIQRENLWKILSSFKVLLRKMDGARFPPYKPSSNLGSHRSLMSSSIIINHGGRAAG